MTAPHPYGPAAVTAPVPAPPRTDGVALASFITALCGLGLIPVVLGHLALSRIARTGTGGTAFAVVGLVLGYTTLAVALLLVLVVGGAIWWGVSA